MGVGRSCPVFFIREISQETCSFHSWSFPSFSKGGVRRPQLWWDGGSMKDTSPELGGASDAWADCDSVSGRALGTIFHCSWKPKEWRGLGVTYEKSSIHSFSHIFCAEACCDSGDLVVRDRQPSLPWWSSQFGEKADYAIWAYDKC